MEDNAATADAQPPVKPWDFTSWLDRMRAYLLPTRVSHHRKCRHHSRKHDQKKSRMAHKARMRNR